MKYTIKRKTGYNWMDGVEVVAETTSLRAARQWIDEHDGELGYAQFDFLVQYSGMKIAMYSFGFGRTGEDRRHRAAFLRLTRHGGRRIIRAADRDCKRGCAAGCSSRILPAAPSACRTAGRGSKDRAL